jgi:hypothetical protein
MRLECRHGGERKPLLARRRDPDLEPTKHYSNPAALAFACPHCGARPGTNCIGDTHSRDGRYQHWMHAARTVLAEMPETREQWEVRAQEIRTNVGGTD